MKKYILLIFLIFPIFVQASDYNWMWIRAADPFERKPVLFMAQISNEDISTLTQGKENIFFIELRNPTFYDPEKGLSPVGAKRHSFLQIHGNTLHLRSIDILSYGLVAKEAKKELEKHYNIK